MRTLASPPTDPPVRRPPTAGDNVSYGRAAPAAGSAGPAATPGPCWRVVGFGVRYTHLNEPPRRGFVLVSDQVRARWSRSSLRVPQADVFADYIAALAEFRRRRAARQARRAAGPVP